MSVKLAALTTRWATTLALFVLAAPASALTLNPLDAGYANLQHPNCGGVASSYLVEITFNEYLSCVRQGVIEFDLASAGVSQVSAATLTLNNGFIGNWSPSIVSIDLYGYAGNGQVTGDDVYVGTYLGTAVWDRTVAPAGPLNVDLTPYVNAQLALGTPVIGINLRAPLQTSNCCTTSWVDFDGALGSLPPTLSLQVVPLPPAVLLFGSALGLMGVMQRKLSA